MQIFDFRLSHSCNIYIKYTYQLVEHVCFVFELIIVLISFMKFALTHSLLWQGDFRLV